MNDPILDLRAACRRSQRLGAACLLAVLALASLAFSSRSSTNRVGDFDEVVANRFVLVDDEGQPRARIEMRDGEPCFELLDSRGQARVASYVKHGDACVLLRDRDGRSRLGLSVDRRGRPQSLLMDEAQTPRLSLTLSDAGRGNLRITDGEGNVPVGLGLLTDGEPWLRPSADHRGGAWGLTEKPATPSGRAQRGSVDPGDR